MAEEDGSLFCAGGGVADGGFAFCAGGFCGGGFCAGASCASVALASSKQLAAHSTMTHSVIARARADTPKFRNASCFVRLITDCASVRNPRVPPELKNHYVRKYRRQAYSATPRASIGRCQKRRQAAALQRFSLCRPHCGSRRDSHFRHERRRWEPFCISTPAAKKKTGGSATRPPRTEAGPMQLESVPPVLLDCQRKRRGRADATAGSGDRHRGRSGRRAGGPAATATSAATRDEEQAENH